MAFRWGGISIGINHYQEVPGVERSEPPGKRQLAQNVLFFRNWRSRFRWGLTPFDSHPAYMSWP